MDKISVNGADSDGGQSLAGSVASPAAFVKQAKKKPRFYLINKYNVAIISLRNQLKQANGIDELTYIASKIIDLENQIMLERKNGYKQLEEEKKVVEKKIMGLQKEIENAADALRRIDNEIEFKLNGYRKTLQTRIDKLQEEYSKIMRCITKGGSGAGQKTA